MTYKDRASFRVEWARLQLAQYVTEKVKAQGWQKVDVQKGTYMSVSKVHQQEGGRPGDVAATKHLVTKCFRMGHPFIKFNTWTERYDVLYFQQEVREEFSRSWTIFEKASSAASSGTTSADCDGSTCESRVRRGPGF